MGEDPRVQQLSDRCQRRRQSRGKVAFSLSQQHCELDVSILSTSVIKSVGMDSLPFGGQRLARTRSPDHSQ
jgi:hypothetical protein